MRFCEHQNSTRLASQSRLRKDRKAHSRAAKVYCSPLEHLLGDALRPSLVLQCNREQGNFAQTGQVGNKRLGSMTRQVLAHLERGCELKAPGGLRVARAGQWRGIGTYP